ncbi:hypothetical protein N9153_03925, partial [Planctomicrobium sp.]|nr:hypothetical protein [Planctomicrobium sp.]
GCSHFQEAARQEFPAPHTSTFVRNASLVDRALRNSNENAKQPYQVLQTPLYVSGQPNWIEIPSGKELTSNHLQPVSSTRTYGHRFKHSPLSRPQIAYSSGPREVHSEFNYTEPYFLPRNFDEFPNDFEPSLISRIVADHQGFYSVDTLFGLGYGFAAGGLMANTGIDESIRDTFQTSLKSSALHAPKELGNGKYTLPIFAAAWAAGNLFEGVPVAETAGEWGERSIRSILVGAPPMLALQSLTGASRPGESSSGSSWMPLQDNNGVSGHSFMGAVPFLTAAQMADDPWAKAALYAGSTLVPLSRVNDDDHYASQAFLGWWVAFLATRAVDHTQSGKSNWSFTPWMTPDSTGVRAEIRY